MLMLLGSSLLGFVRLASFGFVIFLSGCDDRREAAASPERVVEVDAYAGVEGPESYTYLGFVDISNEHESVLIQEVLLERGIVYRIVGSVGHSLSVDSARVDDAVRVLDEMREEGLIGFVVEGR